MGPAGEIGFEVKMLSNCIKRQLDEALAQNGVDRVTGMQGMFLAYLFDHLELADVFQRDLEQVFRIRRSTATGVLQLMERDGMITRESVEHDARLKKLRLTPKAVHDHQIVRQRILEMENRLRTGLSDEEVDLFLKLLLRIRKNVE